MTDISWHHKGPSKTRLKWSYHLKLHYLAFQSLLSHPDVVLSDSTWKMREQIKMFLKAPSYEINI